MTYKEAWHIRFIELMPVGDVVEFVPSSELRRRISSLGALEPCSPLTGSGPAKYYRLSGAKGTVGFISPVTDPSFCSRCSRVRLSSGGKLRPCLLAEDEIDLKGPLRNNASMQELKRLILKAVASKPEHHHLGANAVPVDQKMSQIGG
jgi:cyclic pyranopterin phosphate synthase